MADQIKRKITLTYRWWTEGEVRPEHTEALEEAARDRIFEMVKEGYMSGELCENIRIDDSDGDDDIEYQGWWEFKEEIPS